MTKKEEKKQFGQFFTKNSDYILNGFESLVFGKDLTDPFAGGGDDIHRHRGLSLVVVIFVNKVAPSRVVYQYANYRVSHYGNKPGKEFFPGIFCSCDALADKIRVSHVFPVLQGRFLLK